MKCTIVFFMVLLVSGCASLERLDFSYTGEDGKTYQGGISFSKEKSELENGIVLEETDPETGETKELFAFTEEEVEKIAEKLEEKIGLKSVEGKKESAFSRVKSALKD